MNTRLALFTVTLLLLSFGAATAQISNLTVNGSSTDFTMTSGDVISWHYLVSPAGATADVKIWLDADGNGVLNPTTDVLWQEFTQTDGATNTPSGPPDMDGAVNGEISMTQPVGLAPAKYIMQFSQGGTTLSLTGTVSPLAVVSHTVSGTVTVPAGKSAANLFIEIHRDKNLGEPSFWDAITDASGNYTIAMNADTAGNPWRVNLTTNPYAPAFLVPTQQDVNVVSNVTGVDFAIIAADAQVSGILRDESGAPLVGVDASLMREDTSGAPNTQVYGRSDGNGLFRIGLPASDLIPGKQWQLNASVEDTMLTQNFLSACRQIPSLAVSDSIVADLTIFAVNSQIKGTVRVNGAAPGFPMQIIGMNPDTAQSRAMCDGATGAFTLPVTNKILNYSIFPLNLPPNYSGTQVTAHAGDVGVVVSLTMTDVREANQSTPVEFSLDQNYPNPFNPTTTIRFGLAHRSEVSLIVYDMLGQEVARLVNGQMDAGYHTVAFDGSRLASGVYFYRIEAGNFVQTLKLCLIK